MTILYPTQIDNNITLPITIDNNTPVEAIVVNTLRDAILAIEKTLGINPQSIYGTVANRLDVLENEVSQLISGGTGVVYGGDLSGSNGQQVVVGLQHIPVAAGTPLSGQALIYNGTQWMPTTIGSGFTAGGDLSGNSTDQTVIGIQTIPVNSTTPTSGQVLTFGGGVWAPADPTGGAPSGPASGDLGGTYPNPTVVALQSHAVANINPGDGQVLTWVAAHSDWEPTTIGTGPAGGDLAGNYPNPTVLSLTGDGTNIAIHSSPNLIWDSAINSPTITQADATTVTSNFLIIQGQNATVVSGGIGANVVISAGLGDSGASGALDGNITFVLSSSLVASFNTPATGGKFYNSIGAGRHATTITSSYPIQNTDELIIIGNTGGPATITLPNTLLNPGDTYEIKDAVGSAGTWPITIDGNGANIDATPTFVMNTAYQSLSLVYTGSGWGIEASNNGPAGGDLVGNYPNPTVASLSNTGITSTVALNIKSLIWGTTIVTPSITQADDPTLPVSNSLTIRAQTNTGEGVGGDLNLSAGAGASSGGQLNLQTGVGNAAPTTVAAINTLSQLVTTGRRRAVTSLIVINYDVQTSDDIIALGTNTDTTVITLPPSPTLGDTYTVVDAVGTAAAHNVTVDGNGHNINASSTFTISTNYQSVIVVFTGSIWSII